MKPLFIIPSVLVLSLAAFAQDGAATAYCKYTVAQAEAQRDLLRNPSALVGPTQPSAGTPAQMVFGATVRVSNNLKASLTMKAAHAACDLYMAGSDAVRHITFASARMERDVLAHRIQLIDQASTQLDQLDSGRTEDGSRCFNRDSVAHDRNCFSKIVFNLSRVDSAKFSLRLLVMNRDTASFTLIFSGATATASRSPFCLASYSASNSRLNSSAFSQLRVFALRRRNGPSDPRTPLIHFGQRQRL